MGRKPSLGAKYTKIRNSVIDYLKDKGVYEETDDFQVDELMFNIKLADDAKDDIEVRGINVGKDKWRANPSVNTYMQATKNISSISTKLGINVQERKKLNLTSESVDELDSILG